MFYVYILKSQSRVGHYVGQTNNLEQRIERHNSSKYGYTRRGRPWVLIYSEKYETRAEAMRRERFLKSGKGREFLSNLRK